MSHIIYSFYENRAALTCQRGICDCINPETMTYDTGYRRCSVLVGERCIFTTVETDSRVDGRSWKEEIPCINQALCQDGYCTCFQGFYENSNGTCVPKKDHRDDCETESACRDDKFLVCDASKHCECNSTIASYDFQRQLCVRKAGTLCGDFQLCVENAFCRNPNENSQSLTDAICECEEGHFSNSQGACERKRNFGEECENDSYCQTEDYTRLVCNSERRCGCNSNISFFDHGSNMCRRLAGASCADFPFCIENSECGRLREYSLLDTSEPTCDCATGYFTSVNGTCELQHRYGESCEANDQCKKGLICDKKKRLCQCDLSTSVYDRVKAKCVGLANFPCDETENCITNSECLWGPDDERRKQCVCRTGYAPSSNGSCLASYDVWCSDEWTYACNHEQGLVCFEGRCACKFSDFQNFDTEVKKCVSQVNGPCDKITPCVSNANCARVEDNGMIPRCQCDQGFVPVDGECELSIGQPCNYSTDGSSLKCDRLARLHCLEGKCQCSPLQVFDHQVLKCRGLVGATCQVGEKKEDKHEQDFCVRGAECVKRRFHQPTAGICKCKRGWTTTKDRKCLTALVEENLIRSRAFNGSVQALS